METDQNSILFQIPEFNPIK